MLDKNFSSETRLNRLWLWRMIHFKSKEILKSIDYQFMKINIWILIDIQFDSEFLETSDLIDLREDSELSLDFFLVLTKKWKTATTGNAIIMSRNTIINKITPIGKPFESSITFCGLKLELLVVLLIVFKVSVTFN